MELFFSGAVKPVYDENPDPSGGGVAHGYIMLSTINPVIYVVILFMRIMRVVVRAHK